MKVLYVMGRGRSGSTVFANVVGEFDGYFSGGEIRTLWDPVVAENSACACGEPIRECEVWGRVLAQMGDVDFAHMANLQREIVKERNIRRLLRYEGGWKTLDEFAAAMGRVYEILAEVTKARVVVDSSKRPSYAALIRSVRPLDPYYVHLVRDPRASAYSWKHRRYESVRGGEEVTRRSAFDATLRWDILNLEAKAVLNKAGAHRSRTIRYEDFVARPRDRVEDVLRFVGEIPASSPFVDGRTLTLGPNHTIAGNPSRFRTGTLTLEDRQEWKIRQSSFDRWVATKVALPFLRRYGYPFRSKG